MILQLIAFILFLILILIFLTWRLIQSSTKKYFDQKAAPPPIENSLPEAQEEETQFSLEGDDYTSVSSLDMLNELEKIRNSDIPDN